MVRRLNALILLPLILAGTSAMVRPAASPDLTVHEWGTFTSVAWPDGRAAEWAPFSGPSDLPRFVTLLNPLSVKTGPGGFLPALRATVRMETPVIYFYTGREQTVDVSVRFPHGLITEWYPRAIVPLVPPLTPLAGMTGAIEWKDVRITPGVREEFPRESGPSHYYAARATDASPVQVGAQQEKFLFYRGLASFPVALSARAAANRTIAVENTGGDEIGLYVLFEKRGPRLGYRIVRDAARRVAIVRPELTLGGLAAGTGDPGSLGADLETMLVEQGLYRREAAAMVETWREAWFEDGTRIFYIVPTRSVDAILPLDITPRPASVVRVFVGRLELITPETQTEVEHALRQNDAAALRRHGRFLQPIVQSLADRFRTASDRAAVRSALEAVAAR